MTACYLDSSAIVKLLTDEKESDALRDQVGARTVRLTSRVAAVEVPRALRRKGTVSTERGMSPLEDLFAALSILELDRTIVARAAHLAPPALRSLDAIHLASALSVAEQLEAFITYDLRLADAARAAGLTVIAPA